jgi:hypothetical protein
MSIYSHYDVQPTYGQNIVQRVDDIRINVLNLFFLSFTCNMFLDYVIHGWWHFNVEVINL